jgi:preprotein translocase subunit YajC
VLISSAYAQAAPAPAAASPLGSFEPLLMIGLMFVVMYFVLIRPQMKRAKEHKALLESLAKGDEVVALGGVVGKIAEISDQYVTLEIAPNTQIMVQRPAVQVLLPKGTIKSIK